MYLENVQHFFNNVSEEFIIRSNIQDYDIQIHVTVIFKYKKHIKCKYLLIGSNFLMNLLINNMNFSSHKIYCMS